MILDFDYKKKEAEKKTKDTYFVQVPNSFMRNENLTLQEKALYIYILGFGDKCYQNQTSICEELGITKPTLRKVMQSLEEKKYIYVQRKFGEKNKEKATPIIFPIPFDNETGNPTSYADSIIQYNKMTFPSDYELKK